MSKFSYDDAVAERRIRAYAAMLKQAYQVDDAGLAELCGISAEEMAEFTDAGFRDMNAATIAQLERVTGISFAWLFAESKESEA